MKKFIEVFTTTDKNDIAEKIARVLVEEKWAACVRIMNNAESHYFWKGEVKSEKEFVIVIKTRKDFFKKIERKIKEIHNYELPEIVALPIVDCSKEYLKWMDQEMRDE